MRNSLSLALLGGSLLSSACSDRPCEGWYQIQADNWGAHALFTREKETFEGLRGWEKNPTVYIGSVPSGSAIDRNKLFAISERIVDAWNAMALEVDSRIPQAQLSSSPEFETNYTLSLDDIPANSIVITIPAPNDPILNESEDAGKGGTATERCGDTSIYAGVVFLNGEACAEHGEDACAAYLSHEFGHSLGLAHPYDSGYLMSGKGFDPTSADELTFIPSLNDEGYALHCIYVDSEGCVFEGEDKFVVTAE
ncbi:MAG: hypothetical protein UT55_C0020G0003 [Candidatus Peregrinibacteria bacterium GW2011_GWE2_39_6]|nr:MAG: hypothetical protein UT36_C0015G0003 [Candidatus Peregrinibacteria bacterium GW2011_GWF2_39_17]KKR26028.1 MAG: hypothetical protein UT55_C0020G0003 [Candidatus Peregrinibacteria bacterium GW2011_GWE2_39_6]HCW32045.1 hypothetical protein [Candidatus Peregrinibacteria bacterium]